jgi:hypothetical protein
MGPGSRSTTAVVHSRVRYAFLMGFSSSFGFYLSGFSRLLKNCQPELLQNSNPTTQLLPSASHIAKAELIVVAILKRPITIF